MPTENVKADNILNKNLGKTVQDFVRSKAVKMVLTKKAEDDWTVVATVPKAGGN